MFWYCYNLNSQFFSNFILLLIFFCFSSPIWKVCCCSIQRKNQEKKIKTDMRNNKKRFTLSVSVRSNFSGQACRISSILKISIFKIQWAECCEFNTYYSLLSQHKPSGLMWISFETDCDFTQSTFFSFNFNCTHQIFLFELHH